MTDEKADRIVALLEQIRDRLPLPWTFPPPVAPPISTQPLMPLTWPPIVYSNAAEAQQAQSY